MKDPDHEHRQALALFRYGVIAELVQLPPGSPGISAQIRKHAEQDYTIPGTAAPAWPQRPSATGSSVYRKGGFDALLPKPRSDRGHPRRLPDAVAEALVSIKEQIARALGPPAIQQARQSGADPHGSAAAIFNRASPVDSRGPDGPKSDAPVGTDRRRFAFQYAGELWMSDVMHGVSVGDGRGRRRKTYLIAFLDDATRVIPYAAFALAENTIAFLPVFKQALIRRGLPQRLYVDNGANYRSRQLALVCAKLGVALIHARPHQPQGKGKIERLFRTVRAQLLTQLSACDTESLDTLNRRLWAFIEGEYHHTPHRGLDGRTPLEQWALVGDQVRFPDADIDELFLFEVKRRVLNDRTVSLNGHVYEVDAVLVGETVSCATTPPYRPRAPLAVVHQGQARRSGHAA